MRGASASGLVDHNNFQESKAGEKRRPISVDKEISEQLLSNLLRTENELAAEYRRRNDLHEYQSVHPADVDSFLQKGWERQRQGKTRVRLRRPKAHDRQLEDDTWALFRRMRYPELSGRHFRVEYTRRDGKPDSKQIDVFAKDDETVIVTECKSRGERGRKSLTKDFTETAFLQKPIADAIRRVYGREAKLQIIWLYVTRNIVWSEPDLERASALNIQIMTENEFRYYDKFIRHLGPAARY